MKFLISILSRNRKLGEAYRRIYSEIDRMNRNVELKLANLPGVEHIELWLVDKPAEYFEVVRRRENLIEIHCGVNESLSLDPIDDLKFIDEIKRKIERVVTSCE